MVRLQATTKGRPRAAPGRPVIGLALGSGGARGLVHLGVMAALEEAGIRVQAVAGASMGALVGLGVATGTVKAMRETALGLDWKKALRYFVEPHLPRSGLINGERVVDLIRQYSGDRRIEELPVPYAAVATDLARGSEVTLGKGPATEAIRASIAIPGLFTPVCWKKRLLVDGGLVNPVPVNVARRLGAGFVIAVDATHFDPLGPEEIRPKGKAGKPGWRRLAARSTLLAPVVKAVETWEREPRLLDVMGLSMRIMESHIAERRLEREPADFLIRPRMGNIYFMDFHRAPEIVGIGYAAGRAAIPALTRKLEEQ